jgi:L-lactate dehydrogenase complex protein LldG
MNRDAFLDRVRTAAHAGRAHVPTMLDDVPDRVGYMGAQGDLCEMLVRQVRGVGGNATQVDGVDAFQTVFRELVRQSGARTAFCWHHEFLDRLHVPGLLHDLGLAEWRHDTLTSLSPNDQRTNMLAADIGVSSCFRAVAETGTLAVDARPGQERCVSLLPPMHVAVVLEEQIVPDLYDLIDLLDQRGPAELPSNLTLITGPSKTGDLELQLTTGVHGPGQIHVVVVRELR